MHRLTPLLAAALLACGSSDAPKDETPANGTATAQDAGDKWETQGTLYIGVQSDIGALIPVKPRTQSDNFIISNLAVSLLDADFDCSLKKKPGLAKSWEWSEDGTKVSMELDSSYTWSDGKPVTADDVAFTYELARNKSVASQRFGHTQFMVEGANPRVVDADTLEWEFTRAYDRDTQAVHLSLPAMPRHLLGDADPATLEGNEFATNPTFYGPWKLAKHIPNQAVFLEPNWSFTGPESKRPKLSRVVFKIIPEYSARIIALEKGDVDMVEKLSISDVDRLQKERPDINIVSRGYRGNDYIGWNPKKFEAFADPKVRRALAHAVDTDRIMRSLLQGADKTLYGKRMVGTITPELCGVHNDDLEPRKFDPALATSMLSEAGWTDTDGDGVLDKDGKPFRFTLVTNQGNKRRADATVEIQADLKKIGIDVQLDTKESNTFFQNVRDRNYEAFLAGWSAGLYPDPSSLWMTETEDEPRPQNQTSYSNPEVDALIEKGLSTPDPGEAAPIWKEVQAKVYEDDPYLFLWWNKDIVAIDSRFENTKIDLLSPYHDLNEWSVPTDKVKYKKR